MRFRPSEKTAAVAMRHGRVRSRIPEPLERFTFAKVKRGAAHSAARPELSGKTRFFRKTTGRKV